MQLSLLPSMWFRPMPPGTGEVRYRDAGSRLGAHDFVCWLTPEPEGLLPSCWQAADKGRLTTVPAGAEDKAGGTAIDRRRRVLRAGLVSCTARGPVYLG